MQVCSKSNLTSIYNIRMHVQNKHSNEYKQLEENRVEIERQEDREERRLLLRAIAGNVQNQSDLEERVSAVTADAPDLNENPDADLDSMTELDVHNAEFKDAEETGICPVAGAECFRHRKEQHPDTK